MPALQFGETAAVGYDQAVGHMTRQIIPDLLSGGWITLGQHVLDIATGTGLAAEAAAEENRRGTVKSLSASSPLSDDPVAENAISKTRLC